MLTNKKLGFIGGGNMTEALLKGLLASSSVGPKDVLVSDLLSDRLEYLNKEYKVKITDDSRKLVQKSDILILAVKPQVVGKVLESFSDVVDKHKIIISVAAGVSTNFIESGNIFKAMEFANKCAREVVQRKGVVTVKNAVYRS